jgi:hypothetical protein
MKDGLLTASEMKQLEKQTDENIKTLKDVGVELRRLKQIETSAKNVVSAFSNSIDYDTWDKSLDALEAALKEKP